MRERAIEKKIDQFANQLITRWMPTHLTPTN